MAEIKNTKQQIRLPFVLAIGLAAGILIGANIADPKAADNDLYKSLVKMKEVLTHIDRDYVDEVNTEELVEDAIQHMLEKLDPHSAYIPSKDKERANEDLRGNFDGIGIEFNIFKDTIVVVSPLSGGPSEAVGLMAGDKIIDVDGQKVAGVGFSNYDVRKHLKGPRGSEVEVNILRKGQDDLIKFNIIRDKIPQFSVDVSYMVDKEKGYIKISRFSATTFQEFEEAMKKLEKKGMRKLVLDLQGNPGGYMSQAIAIADEFLKNNNKIVYTKGKESRYNSEANAENKGGFEKGDLVVLINEGSASASEIVSGALQDNDRALVVGRRSFGKGLVQAPFELSDGSELRLTISRYYTPSGRSIQKPYEKNEQYGDDISKRFEHGEFFHADSIHFNDSLKYQTKNGRAVYGGGGIMPDYFVPLDTTLNSSYLNKLFYNNAIQAYTLDYSVANESQLKAMSMDGYLTTFEVTDDMLKELMKVGTSYGVEQDLEDFEANKALFKLHTKAQIARRLWGNEGFYPIYNQTNEIFQQAVKLMDMNVSLESKK